MTLEEILAAMPNLKEEELDAISHQLYELSVKATRQWVEQRSRARFTRLINNLRARSDLKIVKAHPDHFSWKVQVNVSRELLAHVTC